MVFAPEPTPRGYSYFVDAPRDWWAGPSRTESSSTDAAYKFLTEAAIDELLKTQHARNATLFVQKAVSALHQTPAGKVFINKLASVSLNNSVQGAAAISHVSKITRTHGISSFGTMLFNDAKLLVKYTRGDITGAELGDEIIGELLGQTGDMLGWGFSLYGSKPLR
ncbi:hypothetical protein ACHAPT_008625 [Fusarium lateritium]